METIIGVDGEKYNVLPEGGLVRNTDHIKYKEVGKMWFHEETPDKVCRVLNNLLHTDEKVKIYQGDVKTGRVWAEEWDTIGTIGRSTGTRKIPLLITEGEYGGPGILDHCIVAIKSISKMEFLYVADNFQAPVVTIVPSDLKGYKYNTMYNGELHGRHKTMKDALKTRDVLL